MSKQSAVANGTSYRWKKIREKVILRDMGICQNCGLEGNHVDHIIPRRLGGDDSMGNLQLLCQQCNLRKGGRFFDGAKSPMTPPELFAPRNDEISHYQP